MLIACQACLPCDVLQPGSRSGHIASGVLSLCGHSKIGHRCCLPVAHLLQVLTFKCGFVEDDGIRQLLSPQNVVLLLKLKATLTRDFMGTSEGEKVDVEVDLFEAGTVKIGKVLLPAQLLLGQPITGESDFKLLMTGKGDEEEEDGEGKEEEGDA